MKHIAFLCVANSARSQMAEGLARHLAPAGLTVSSAGSAPGSVHPMAIAVLDELGVDIRGHRSKPMDELPWDAIDCAVTLCAEEACPVVRPGLERLHWPLPDPAGASADPQEELASFRRIRDQIKERLTSFFAELG